MNISLFGLGYVGAVTAGCLARQGHMVVGVDPQQGKIDCLNTGRSPIVEPGLEELIREGQGRGAIRATTDAAEAVRETEVSLICVGTPSLPSGALDTRHVEQVSGQIAQAIREKNSAHTVIFRSTMLPGSTRRLFEKFFAELAERQLVRVLFYPEFLREGTAIEDFAEPSLSVVGMGPGNEGEETAPPVSLWPEQTQLVTWETAELLKYACNAFHATKVDFANEIGRISKTIGIDGQRVMQLLCMDKVLNISSYYMRPGNPFGGSCLPKDVSALEIFGQNKGVSLPLIENLQTSNQRHLQHLLSLVEARQGKVVTIIGLAFKANTDDLRGSAMVELASELVLRGFTVRAYDPRVEPERLVGANEKLAERKLPGLETLLEEDLGTALGTDGVVVAFNKCVGTEELQAQLQAGHHVIDVNGWRELQNTPASYEGLCW